MRIHTIYLALARMRGVSNEPYSDRRQQSGRTPPDPDARQNRRHRELMGIGVLIAALVVVFWSGSPVVLALGALLTTLVVCAGLLFIVWRRLR